MHTPDYCVFVCTIMVPRVMQFETTCALFYLDSFNAKLCQALTHRCGERGPFGKCDPAGADSSLAHDIGFRIELNQLSMRAWALHQQTYNLSFVI